MMTDNRQRLMEKLEKAERLARSSRWLKWVHSPLLYPALLCFNYIIYPRTQRGKPVWVNTFFGRRMKTILPSGTDIMLHTIKAHDSEIRMSKFLLHTLASGDTFIDIGAHYGYYTLMASEWVGKQGNVYAIEASSSSALVLRENTAHDPHIALFVAAASDHAGEVTFYEFSGPYAEYNTTAGEGYEGQKWLTKVKRIENRVPTLMVDDLIRDYKIQKAVMKVDAEGGELAVLKGMPEALRTKDLTIVMEYLTPGASASLHHQAVVWLRSFGYHAHCIDLGGYIHPVGDIDKYLLDKNLTSDNLVFIKG